MASVRNDYEFRGEHVFIKLKSTSHGEMETKISITDFEIANSMPYTWYPKYSAKVDGFYVAGNIDTADGKRTTTRLHRWILRPDDEIVIDHINHDTLDNSRENLRLATNSQNQFNRFSGNKGSSTGVLGVSYREDSGKFRARVYKDRKLMYSEHFDSLTDAELSVIKVREELFGEFANKNVLNSKGAL